MLAMDRQDAPFDFECGVGEEGKMAAAGQQHSLNFQGGTAAQPTSVIELTVSCRTLLDMDIFSKSDPMCVLFVRDFGGTTWSEFGRTETIQNTLNPDFAKKFVLNYHFEEVQWLKFEVYDVDNKSSYLRDHDFLGKHECSLGEIVGSGFIKKPLGVDGSGNHGMIIVTAEEIQQCRTDITMQFLGRKLDRKDFFGKSDPFLTIRKYSDECGYVMVYRSEYLKRTLNPTWRPFTLSLHSLCNGDWDRKLQFQCYDYNLNGSHSFIGDFTTTPNVLARGPGPSNVYQLVNDSKRKKKTSLYKNSGEIHLMTFSQDTRHSFIDFVRGGTELVCTFAIDFTASNGDPKHPHSLHSLCSPYPNPYIRALRAVGDVIRDYDSDGAFPVFGFGARLPPNGRLSHCFPINGKLDPHCLGVEGVLDAYRLCLPSIQLYGPTNFAPIIQHVTSIAATHKDGLKYHILLIITDGIITDLPQTKEAIVQASVLPLSIIIVGVGAADFTTMEVLDGDLVRLSYRGIYADRDIVQFVPFREFDETENPYRSQARLAKAVLAEIPGQLLSYMKSKGIQPGSPKLPDQLLPPDPESV